MMKIQKSSFENLPKIFAQSIGSLASLIIHTLLFAGIFALRLFNVSFNDILLLLTTIVSLEAIYLSIFIQISVNKQLLDMKEVSKGLDEINENVEDLQKDVSEMVEE